MGLIMSVSTVSSLMSIYNTDGSLKTAQQWNVDRASITYSAAEQAQLDAVEARTLAPYISTFAYQNSVQGTLLMNDVDTSGASIPVNARGFSPDTLTAPQASLYAQAKQLGRNPTDPSSLLEMLGIARNWTTAATPAAARAAVANPNPAAAAATASTASSGGASAPATSATYVSADVNGRPLSPNVTMLAPAEVGGGTLHTDASSVLYYAPSGQAGAPVAVGSDFYKQLVAAGLLGTLAS